jgi:hypothetical protein
MVTSLPSGKPGRRTGPGDACREYTIVIASAPWGSVAVRVDEAGGDPGAGQGSHDGERFLGTRQTSMSSSAGRSDEVGRTAKAARLPGVGATPARVAMCAGYFGVLSSAKLEVVPFAAVFR